MVKRNPFLTDEERLLAQLEQRRRFNIGRDVFEPLKPFFKLDEKRLLELDWTNVKDIAVERVSVRAVPASPAPIYVNAGHELAASRM